MNTTVIVLMWDPNEYTIISNDSEVIEGLISHIYFEIVFIEMKPSAGTWWDLLYIKHK